MVSDRMGNRFNPMGVSFESLKDVLKFCMEEREGITVNKVKEKFDLDQRTAMRLLNNLARIRFIERIGLTYQYRFIGKV